MPGERVGATSSLLSLAPPSSWGAGSTGHAVQFYERDAFLLDSVQRFIGPAVAAGDAAIIIATEAHREALAAGLTAYGTDVIRLRNDGRYVPLDAAETLSHILVDEWPDETRFVEVIGSAIARASHTGPEVRVHAFGEMVALLWMEGKQEAAIRLEELWSHLAKTMPFSLMCAYPIAGFHSGAHETAFLRICSEHSRVIPAESYSELSNADDRLRAIGHLQHKSSVLEAETTARQLAESSLRRNEAEREELLRTTQRARAEAEAANRAKDEFLAMLGHELRNPLSAVRNAVLTARLNGTRRDRALEIAQRQTERLSSIVDDLLDVARITQGKIALRKEQVFLADVVHRSIDGVRALLEERGQLLSVSLPNESVALEADPGRLEQVFMNLVANAAKYSPPGSAISIRGEHQDDHAILRVRDQGVGIAAEMLPRVFELFAQADRSLDRVQGGLGVGLTIAKRLVELHGGRLEAHSSGLGQGAEFVVWLPALPAAAPATAPAPQPHATERRARVLIIEDNEDSADSLKMLLELLGHHVRVAHDGFSALDVARANIPDVMIVDIGLPGIDGYEVARLVRRDERLQRVTLVALTGYGREEDKRQAMLAGFDYHLVKPIDLDALRGLVGRLEEPKPAATDPRTVY